MPSTKTLVIRGVLFNWLGRICSVAVTFVLTPILVTSLGNESYGIWAIVMAMTNYYAMADAGLRGGGTKYIAQFQAVGDRDGVNRVFVTSLVVYGALSVVPLLLASVVAWAFPLMFKGVTEDLTTIRWVVMIVGLNVSVQLLGQVFGATLVGLKRFDLVNLVGVASNVLQGVLMVVTLRLGGGLIGMACSVLAVGVLARLAEDVLALRLLPHISLSWTYFDRALLKTLFRFGALNVLIVIKLRFIDSIGGVITGVILRVDKVPFYAVAENLCRHAVATAKGVAQVAMPLASQLEAQKRQQDLVRVLILGPRVLTTLALTMIVVVTVLGRSLLRLWLDEEFATQAFGALCVLMIARGVEICSLSLFTMLVGMDRMVFLSRLAVLEIVIVVGLGASLTATIGVAGMAWATLVSQVLVHGAILPRFACREIGYPWHRWVVQVFAPAATATLPALALAVAFHTYWPPEQLGVLVAQIVCVVGLAAASGFVMCLEPSMRADVLRVFLPKRIGDVP